jgi:hypothetical protein
VGLQAKLLDQTGRPRAQWGVGEGEHGVLAVLVTWQSFQQRSDLVGRPAPPGRSLSADPAALSADLSEGVGTP